MGKLLKNVYKRILNLDSFLKPISLTFNEHKSYKSLIGTISTIIILTITGFYGTNLILKVLSGAQYSTNIGVRAINYAEEPLNTTFDELDIKIAFSWEGSTNFDLFNTNLGKIALIK